MTIVRSQKFDLRCPPKIAPEIVKFLKPMDVEERCEMDTTCPECDRLKQASNDAIRVETIMLAQKFLAASNGYDTWLPNMVALLREASDLRREARHAFNCHCATHENGQQITPVQESSLGRTMEKRMARSN